MTAFSSCASSQPLKEGKLRISLDKHINYRLQIQKYGLAVRVIARCSLGGGRSLQPVNVNSGLFVKITQNEVKFC